MPRRSPPPLALAYHAVGDVPPPDDYHRLFVSPEALERQLATLRRWGYRFVTFSELLDRIDAGGGRGHVAMTFDDGFADNLHVLVPLLRRHGGTATVFAVSGWLGKPHPAAPAARILAPDELRELHAASVEIGGHTVTHADLSRASYSTALQELADSRTQLEEIIGAPVTVAAYPYGAASPEARRACRDAGFRGACRTGREHGLPVDSWYYPRENMGNRSSALGLRLKREGRYEDVMRLKFARAVRRVRYRLP